MKRGENQNCAAGASPLSCARYFYPEHVLLFHQRLEKFVIVSVLHFFEKENGYFVEASLAL